jgi:hypothetical protein
MKKQGVGSRFFRMALPGVLRIFDRPGIVRSLSCGTILMSSSVMLLWVDEQNLVKPGLEVEAKLEWPALLNDVVPLIFVTRGKIIAADGMMVVVKFSPRSYDLKTHGSVFKSLDAA